MIKYKDIAFTIYAVSDIGKARAFYEGILGLKPNSEFDGSNNAPWVEYNIGSGTLAIGCAPDQWKPSEDGAVVALEVENFDETIAYLKSKNVGFKLDAQDFPTCKMAVIEDQDKNKVAIHHKK